MVLVKNIYVDICKLFLFYLLEFIFIEFSVLLVYYNWLELFIIIYIYSKYMRGVFIIYLYI